MQCMRKDFIKFLQNAASKFTLLGLAVHSNAYYATTSPPISWDQSVVLRIHATKLKLGLETI